LVVLGTARHYGPEFRFDVRGPQWTTGLGEMVRRIEDAGSRAVVLGPAPHPRADVPDCLSEHLGDVTACAQPVERALDRGHIEAETSAVERAGGAYVDVAPWFCDRQRCAAVVGNLLVYRDDNHLTTAYAGWLAPVVGTVLDSALAPGRN
ncbi:MAG: acyltransferase, partial [Actinomycetota bacterium]|nr:acyltransferase [Actinomycetota bacterium]